MVVGGTCRGTVAATCAAAPTATASSRALMRSATTGTMRFSGHANLETRSPCGSQGRSGAAAAWCRPVVAAASSCARVGESRIARSIWNSRASQPEPSAGHYCVALTTSEKLVCRSRALFVGRRGCGGAAAAGLREASGLGVATTTFGPRRVLRGDGMDCAMPHLMDTAPFRGVCQAPSRVRDARDLSVPMAFFGFGKSRLPEVVQVGFPRAVPVHFPPASLRMRIVPAKGRGRVLSVWGCIH